MAVSVSRRRTVGTCARDGVERVSHVHDPGRQRNIIAAQAERVAASVRSLVVQFHDRDVRGEKRHLAQDMRANRGVTLELLELLGGQRRGFPKDRVADTDLADVVEKSAESEHFEVGLAELQPPADEDRKSADPLGVTGGVRIPRVEHGRERSNRTEIGRLRLGLSGCQATDEIVERFRERIEFQTDPAWMQRLRRSRDAAIIPISPASWSMGPVSVCASQKLPSPASTKAPSASVPSAHSALRVAAPVAASIEESV